jgi:hypothetical protein
VGELDMGKWPSWWYVLTYGVIGFIVLLGGIVSGNVVAFFVGAVWLSAASSAYLIFYVKSEHRVEKAFELIFALLALGVVVYGYLVTGSLVLGVITLFMVAMVFFAFVISYLLPKIRSKSGKSKY